jgi:Tfp pilus assembly protein PilO
MKLNLNTDIRKLLNFDVKSLDLKNFDLARLKNIISSRQDLLINGIVILLTLIISFYLVNSKKQAAQSMRTRIIALEEKVDAITQLQNTQNQLQNYLSALSGSLSADQIIELVSTLATEHNLQVTFFSPAQKEDKGVYDKAMVRVNLTSGNYENIGRFVAAIEDSGKSLKIKSWTGRMETAAIRQGQQSTDKYVLAEIEIESLSFKK